MKFDIIKNEKLKEEIHFTKLENGLEVFWLPKKDYMRKYAVFTTKYGSNDNKFVPIGEKNMIEVPEGVAHFLEHKLFEEPDENIFDKFSELGSYVNAYTNFTQTAYLFECTDKFYDNLELLVKFVQNPYFTDENVEKEKGIIEQEIRMYDDSAGWKVFFNCLRGMYYDHPVKIDIAGTVDTIKEIDKDILYKCYNTFYHPKNMVLFMVGDVDFDKAVEVIDKSQKSDIQEYEGEIKRNYVNEKKSINKKIIEENLSVSMPLFNLGFKDTDVGFDGKKLLAKEIATNIILEMIFGESSEFYQEMYNEGFINNSFGGQYIGSKDYGHSIVGGEASKPKEVKDKIISYIEGLKEKGLDNADFERIKKKFIGNHLSEFDSMDYIANKFTSYYFNNILLTDYFESIENIKFNDVEKRFKEHFNEVNCTLSIVNPKV